MILILGLVIFLGIHSVRIAASDFRDAQVAKLGEGPWKAVYSVIALVGLVLIVWGYGMARMNPVVLWVAPLWMSHVTALLMLVSIILLVVSQFPPGRIKAAVKHPMLLAVKIWAPAHLLVNGDLASLLLFGGFLVWAVLDRIAVKRRVRAGEAVEPRPGPVRWDVISVAVGVLVYLAFVLFLHEWLFGVAPIVMR
nr:NnrU family protein [Pseudohoeflea sp. DP4N28-3]